MATYWDLLEMQIYDYAKQLKLKQRVYSGCHMGL